MVKDLAIITGKANVAVLRVSINEGGDLDIPPVKCDRLQAFLKGIKATGWNSTKNATLMTDIV